MRLTPGGLAAVRAFLRSTHLPALVALIALAAAPCAPAAAQGVPPLTAAQRAMQASPEGGARVAEIRFRGPRVLPEETLRLALRTRENRRFLGIRDVAFVLRTELDELVERLSFEKDRLEKDEAIYGMTDCDAEMKFYGREVTRVISVLRNALKELRHLQQEYRVGKDG